MGMLIALGLVGIVVLLDWLINTRSGSIVMFIIGIIFLFFVFLLPLMMMRPILGIFCTFLLIVRAGVAIRDSKV